MERLLGETIQSNRVSLGFIRGPAEVRRGLGGGPSGESWFEQLSKLKPDVIYNKLGVHWGSIGGLSGVCLESIGSPSGVRQESVRSPSWMFQESVRSQLVTNFESWFEQLSKLKPDVIYNIVYWGLLGVQRESVRSPSVVSGVCQLSVMNVSGVCQELPRKQFGELIWTALQIETFCHLQ
jgi:hypothetical protein